MPDLFFPLAAAVLWAVSSPIVNAGLRSLRTHHTSPVPALFTGMLCSLTVGTAVVWVVAGFPQLLAVPDLRVVAAGVLTFPIGTGLYYLAAVTYAGRAELAAQFANVKPLLVLGAASALFGERIGVLGWAAVGAVLGGVAVLVTDALRRRAGRAAAALGLSLAAAWAGGEVLVRAATDTTTGSAVTTFGALWSSLLLTALAVTFAGGLAAARGTASQFVTALRPRRAHAAFAAHGLVSFGGAYALYFHSIGEIGLSRTVVVTVFWPTLALGLTWWLTVRRGERYRLRPATAASLALFTLASVGYTLGASLTG